jgi:hypothetical protein
VSRWIAWALWSTTMLLVALLVPLASVDPTAFSGRGSDAVGIAVVLFILVFATVGLAVALRRPRNAIGWTLGFAGLVYAVASATTGYANYAFLVKHGTPVGATAAAWTTEWVWNLALAPGAIFPLMLFPDGELPSPRWRPVLWLAVAAVVVASAAAALSPGRFPDYPVNNPVGIDGGDSVLTLLSNAGTLVVVVIFLAVVVSLVVRFRRARGVERQQLEWLTYSAGVIVVAGVGGAIFVEPVSTDTSNALESLAVTTYPVALGVAMLRYRLYDIDVVINRTLVYGALTATLAAIYLGSVLLLQLVLDPVTSGSSLAVAVSTLAVAALFRPARARIQAVSARGCGNRWTWRRWALSCGRSCERRCSPPMSPSG